MDEPIPCVIDWGCLTGDGIQNTYGWSEVTGAHHTQITWLISYGITLYTNGIKGNGIKGDNGKSPFKDYLPIKAAIHFGSSPNTGGYMMGFYNVFAMKHPRCHWLQHEKNRSNRSSKWPWPFWISQLTRPVFWGPIFLDILIHSWPIAIRNSKDHPTNSDPLRSTSVLRIRAFPNAPPPGPRNRQLNRPHLSRWEGRALVSTDGDP